MDVNKLSLNLSKTKVMMFGICKKQEQSISINGGTIEMVSENKFLGTIIDNKLNWKPHFRHIENKISKNISVMNKTKYVLQPKMLHMLYCCHVIFVIWYRNLG